MREKRSDETIALSIWLCTWITLSAGTGILSIYDCEIGEALTLTVTSSLFSLIGSLPGFLGLWGVYRIDTGNK